jgi:putative inorganic carbon (hco3(-)) transporter
MPISGQNLDKPFGSKVWSFYVISGLFIVASILGWIFRFYYVGLLPVILLFLLYGFYSPENLFYVIVFTVPLSIPLDSFLQNPPFNMAIPSEPIIVGFTLLFLIRCLTDRGYDNRITHHPVTIAILINLFWILFTSATSSMLLVSFKFFLSRLWFVVVFYFIGILIFTKSKNHKRFFWLYIIPFCFVIGYTLIKLVPYGIFNQKVAYGAMYPLSNDHTSFAAVLVMYIPVLVGFLFMPSYKPLQKNLIFLVLVFFIFGLLISYTRAAWLSLVIMLAVFIIIKLKVRFSVVMITTIVGIVMFFVFKDSVIQSIESNRTNSSTDIAKHITSISNVSSDPSNVERLNRWSCALRMALDKPLVGFGPGTYMFQYASYQVSSQKTSISTDFADGGNAHSEYLGSLAESGIIGVLSFLAVIITTITTTLRVYKKLHDKELKILVLSAFLGLVTYFVHGFLNNFLDTDKASVPFWGFIALIVAIDIYFSEEKNEVKQQDVL